MRIYERSDLASGLSFPLASKMCNLVLKLLKDPIPGPIHGGFLH